jgi:hypothetical protein
MDKKQLIKYLLPVLIFAAITFVYFLPALTGKMVEQDDILNGKGIVSEVVRHHQETGEWALWTNALFSGMPSFQAGVDYPSNVFHYIKWGLIYVFGAPSSIYLFSFLMIGFYGLLLAHKVNPWIAFAGAIAFAFSAFFLISFAAGHIAKVRVATFIAPMLTGVILAYKGKHWLGWTITALSAGLAIQSNHIQVAYYGVLFIGIFVLVELYFSFKEGRMKGWLVATAGLALAGFIAILPNASGLWSNYDYQKETMRGGISELEKNQEFKGGLDYDYAMNWSYGKFETLNLIYPDITGGGMTQNYEGTQTYEKYFNMIKSSAIQNGVPRKKAEAQASRTIASFFYWGDQTLVNGGYYIGATAFFLFVLAMFILPVPYRIWLGASVVLSIMMAWGKNLDWFNRILFEYLPLYKKFRVPSMSFTILFLAVPLGGFLAAATIFKKESPVATLKKALLYTFYITGGLSLGMILFGGGLFSFEGLNDANLAEQGLDVSALMEDRASLMRASAFRVLLVCGAVFGLLWFYLSGQVKASYLGIGLALVVMVDQFSFLRQHLSSDDYVTEKEFYSVFEPTAADRQIKQDPDPHYRVFNTTRNITSDAATSYNHKSIAGYHGAKLGRYQDLIEGQLVKGNQQVYNMLNVKYFIMNNQGQLMPQRNFEANGNAWVPEKVSFVSGADAEMAALDSLNTKIEVVADSRYQEYLKDVKFSGGTSEVELTSYNPNTMTYTANVEGGQRLVVFSEIFYEGGGQDWKATIDGEPVEIIRVNYLLRAIKIPEGQHNVVFSFEPRAYIQGEKIAKFGSAVFLLFAAIGFYRTYKEQKIQESN